MSVDKPIIISNHAYMRMEDRDISRAQVEKTIRIPDSTESAKRGRIRAKRKFGDEILHVFYKETPGAIIAVSEFWRKK